MIVFGKLTKQIFSNEDFQIYLFTMSGGKRITAIYHGETPPKPLKTVQYQLNGYWDKYHGKKQFVIVSYERSAVTTVNYNHKSEQMK